MGAALKYKQANVPRQQGEQARLKVVAGPDAGAVFVLTAMRATIGRGEENDVMVTDLKASRRHAEVIAGAGGWSIRDLGSANGILYNGRPTRTATLRAGDTVTFGETTLEFVTSDAATMMLVAPPKSLAAVQAEQAEFQRQQDRAKSFASFGNGGMQPKAGGAKGPLKSPLVMILLVAGAGFALFYQEPKPPRPAPAKPKEAERDLASYLPQAEPGPAAKTAESFFKAGMREFREKNYLRARQQFETVLQMSPGDPLARLYLENCNLAIEDTVKFHLDRGKKSMAAGKLKDARGHFESVMRLLYRDQSNASYVEARDQLDKVNLEMGGGS